MSDIQHPVADYSRRSSDIRHPTFLALGDSYTVGEGVLPQERWPTQLAQQLHFSAPKYVAETGWTAVDLLEAIELSIFAPQYDWVSVMIGVNDQYDGLGEKRYRVGLNRIVDFALSKVANAQRVVVLSIPDYSVTPFAHSREPNHIAHEVASFNAIAQDIAAANHTTYCDITSESQLAANDSTLLVEDGLHPSGKMYRMWVERIRRDIKC